MTSVEQEKINEIKTAELRTGDRTLLHEAHELVINGNYQDLPEAIHFITDPNNQESLMYRLIEQEEYEICGKFLKEKEKIFLEIQEGLEI